MTTHVADWKYKEVEQLTTLITSKKVIGVIEIGGIPAPQLQQMRKNMGTVAVIRSAKNSLIIKAVEEAGKSITGLDQLKTSVKGQAALIVTDMNPFKLFSQVKATRTMAPAKGGETAAHDISVSAGETPFKPGPIVGELQKAGIPAAIQEGKVVIKTDKIIVPAGKKIPKNVAQMLTRLEIYPIEIGMTLHAVYENGAVFKADVLDINADEFMMKIRKATGTAFGLAMESTWVTPSTIRPLLQKAFRNAFYIALEKNIITKDTASHLLSKAYQSMLSVALKLKQEALDEELKKKLT
ncbi:MAG: 50S ribosomal protein L10 [Methanobacteriota archaeon]